MAYDKTSTANKRHGMEVAAQSASSISLNYAIERKTMKNRSTKTILVFSRWG
jgi:hypothetical protein